MTITKLDNSDRAAVLTGQSWARCEELIRDFEASWQRQESPAIEAYLRAEPPNRHTLLIELIHVDLEFRLKAGDPARVEAYLLRFPELATQRNVILDLLREECLLRRALGEAADLTEYHSRFPLLAEALAVRLAGDVDTSTGEDVTRPARTPPPVIPGYEIVSEIGRGGMGVIYLAREPNLDRRVALKFLPGEYARDAEHLERFLHEARAASALNHPNICTVHALGEHEGRPFIVLEYIDGLTLRTWAARKPDLRTIVTVIRQAVRALAAAHAADIVHRDIKPENIMLRPDGFVKVVDFGLARRAPLAGERGLDTGPGAIMGTAAYMSPEQTRGEPVDGASDLFSIGIVLYQLVTGRHPFEASSVASIMHGIASEQPVSPTALNPAVPRRLADIIAGLLHKERLLRPTAVEVLESLTLLLEVEHFPTPTAPTERPVVHREAELEVLRSAMARADAGQGSLLCISGEPGIGKTTLVEDFLVELQSDWPACAVLRGHCSERLAGTEAYFPVLDALAALGRADAGGPMARHVKVLAPSWHTQLVTAADPALAETLTPPKATTQQAMLREFVNLLQELTRRGPVVLFIDDVHWADISTVDLLARVAGQCGTLRLLIVVTFRPTELLIGPHPFHRVKLELQGRGLCQELALGFLDREQVGHYLDLLFPVHAFPTEFIDFIVSHTEGSPLFMSDLLAYLRERGVLVERSGKWSLVGKLPDLRRELPGSVRGMIERKLERLDQEDRRILSIACVQGQEFDSAVVAGAAKLEPADVEERLRVHERVHGLIRLVREHELPDHTLSLRFAFVHVLYQQALYAELSPTRRASLAIALATTLQRHHERDCPSVANELACLFEVGRDFPRASHQFWLAARNAARVFAHREAVTLARHGLRLVNHLQPSEQRDRLELALQTTLGLQLQVTDGFAAPAAKVAYTRARELTPNPPTIESFPVLWGLWLHAKVRSELNLALALAAELETLARRAKAPDLVLQAQQALAVTTLCRGDVAATVRHMEHAKTLYHPDRHRSHSYQFGQDPLVACQAFGAVALQLLGETERAKHESRQALELSYRLMQPSSQVLALHFAAMLYQLNGEPAQCRIYAELCSAIATEHCFAFWQAGSLILRGWATAITDEPLDGVVLIRQGLRDWKATGSVTYETYYLGLLAAALLKQDARAEAADAIDQAIQLADATQEHLYCQELHRLQSELTAPSPG